MSSHDVVARLHSDYCPRGAILLYTVLARNTNAAVETGLDSEIAKTNHGDARPMVKTQNANNVLEDCVDQTSLLGDAEPRLNIFHTHVAASLFGPI